MSSAGRGRRSARVAIASSKALEAEEATLDGSASETTSNSATASHPSSPRISTPPPYSPCSSIPNSPSKAGFVRIDQFLKHSDCVEENIENSTIAIAALTALAAGECALIPSLESTLKERMKLSSEVEKSSAIVEAVEGAGQLRISLVNAKRRPRKASKKTRIYTF